MKTISVNLTCKTCHSTFTHTRSVKGNGNSYKYWAVNNVTQCPRCFSAERRKDRVAYAIQFLSDNHINVPELRGTEAQIGYAKRLREDFIEKYYLDILKVTEKYMAEYNSFRYEADKKGIEPGQVALQRWDKTRDYYLFAAVYSKSASFLINMLLEKKIERVA